MKVIRRSIIVILASAFMSVAPGAGFADLVQDCTKSCGDQKASDDKNCPGPDQGTGQGRTECLKNNQDIYNACLQNCSPSTPPAATAPKTTSPQGAAAQGKTPQAATPQGATPQGQIPHTGTPQGPVTPQGLTPP